MIIDTMRLRNANLKEVIDHSLPSLETDSQNWISLNSRDPNTLRQYDRERMKEVSSYLYYFNPLASRIVKVIRDFTIGQGVNIYASNAKVDEILKKFWHNDYCDMDKIVRRMSLDLSLYGSVLLPAAVGAVKGDVMIGYASPFSIKEVVPDPRNIILARNIVVDSQDEPFVVSHIDEDPESPTYGYRTGNCFFMAVNSAGEDLDGISDLLASADFADCLDQLSFSSLDRMNEEMKWLWDITMTGSDDVAINAMAEKLAKSPPAPGSYQVHNEGIQWKPVQAGVKASNIRDEFNMMRDYTLGGAGLASFFFNNSDNSGGRQSVEAEAGPPYQMLSSRQFDLEIFFREILNFVIDQKILHGELEAYVDRTFTVSLPKISMRDIQRLAGALSRVASALEISGAQGWTSKDDNSLVFRGLVDQFGLGIPLTGAREDQTPNVDLAPAIDESPNALPSDPVAQPAEDVTPPVQPTAPEANYALQQY